MKLKELETQCQEAIVTTKTKYAIELLIGSLEDIKSCEKTLKQLKQKHEDLLETDIEDLDVDEFEY